MNKLTKKKSLPLRAEASGTTEEGEELSEELTRAERALCWYALRGDAEALAFIRGGWKFTDAGCAEAAQAICDLDGEVTELSVAEKLSHGGKDGYALVTDLIANGIYAISARECIQILHDALDYEKLRVLGDALAASSSRHEESPSALVERLLGQLRGLSGEGGEEFTPAEAIQAAVEAEQAAPLQIGIEALDSAFGRIRRGDLVVLAASTGVGKSAMALQMAVAMARQGLRCLYEGLEMGRGDYGARMLAQAGALPPYSEEAVKKVLSDFERIGLTFRRDPTVNAIRARLVRERFDVLVVDYAQLLTGAGRTEVERLAEISRGLTRLALDLNVLLVAVAQTNRNAETENRLPELRDLYGSGQLARDAALVALLADVDERRAEEMRCVDLYQRVVRRGEKLKVLMLPKSRKSESRKRQLICFDGARMTFTSCADWMPR